jgi:4-amino-4-deoxy-L-arabinose transferase-like glycosyltransferase
MPAESGAMAFRSLSSGALLAVVLLALVLRLQHLGNPILDRPSWRQGDTAMIARNFATKRYNIFYPQLNDQGPKSHYVELEAQIVPFISATLYKIFGVHEFIGRLTSIAFSVGTVWLVAVFARWLFASTLAGLFAGLAYAIMPGSIYYGRTFMPESAVVFFSTAAVYLTAQLLLGARPWRASTIVLAGLLLGIAFAAKPVSLLIVIPLIALFAYTWISGTAPRFSSLLPLVVIPAVILVGFDAIVSSHTQSQWARSIAEVQIWPALIGSLHDSKAFAEKAQAFLVALAMLRRTMIGPGLTILLGLGLIVSIRNGPARLLVYAWFLSALLYVWAVVTVVRVDYYLALLLPPAALVIGAFCSDVTVRVRQAVHGRLGRFLAAGAAALLLAAILAQNLLVLQPYYEFDTAAYRSALGLDAQLPRRAAVAIDRSDPALLYYIDRPGWIEDAFVWRTTQAEDAIAQGASYFIDVDPDGLRANPPLLNWVRGFPFHRMAPNWTIYLLRKP